MNWYVKCWQQYADFSGRARRSEYWYFVLFNFLVEVVIGAIEYMLGISFLTPLYGLAVFVPSLAVCVRRMHDVGKSGWYVLICLIPIIGWIWSLILYCRDSQSGMNEWGPNPKEI